MNQKLYGLRLSAQKTFALIVYGIAQRLDWVERIKLPMFLFGIDISFRSIFRTTTTLILSIGTAIKTKLRLIDEIKTVLTLNTSDLSEKRYFFIDSSDKITLLFTTALARAKYYVSTHLTLTMAMTVVSSAATFVRLSVYDLLTLGDMDGITDNTTLGSLDSV